MKEIKFRVWDGDKIISLSIAHTLQYIVIQDNDENSKYANELSIEYQDVILMQYIWLKDKNKKEIYNSDLLKDNEGRIFEVVPDDRFSQTGYRMLCLKNKSEKDHIKVGKYIDFYSWMTSEKENYLEVIGNKYEDKKLLDEVK